MIMALQSRPFLFPSSVLLLFDGRHELSCYTLYDFGTSGIITISWSCAGNTWHILSQFLDVGSPVDPIENLIVHILIPK